jgi:transposase-like protein
MTFVSVADACRRLGIDAKTLRRWLADAQLSLQSHPSDGRKKGVSAQHLQALAPLHQRSLTPLPQQPPALEASEEPSLPAVLLALPERLGALHAQLAALQQQVAALTHLLQQHVQEPAISVAPAKPPRTTKHLAKPPSSAPRSRRAATAKTPAKPTHVLPRVEYDRQGRYVVICPKGGLLPLEPDSPEWFAWLAKQSSFRFMGKVGRLTAHHERRVPRGAWRAHRQIRNHSHTLRLAPTQELTIAVLEQAAEALQAHLT